MRPIAALVAAVAVLGASCGGGDGGEDAGRLPDVELVALADGAAPLAVGDLRGPAVVNLWATWCQPCRRELPAFQEVSAARPDVRFVGVDIAEDAARARDFLGGLGITFEQYLDDRGELSEALGTAVLPVTLVVGRDGHIATEHVGPMSVEDLEDALDDL